MVRVIVLLAALGLLGVVWWVTIIRIAWCLIRTERNRCMWLALLLPSIWSLLAIALLAVLPLSILTPIMVIYTLN